MPQDFATELLEPSFRQTQAGKVPTPEIDFAGELLEGQPLQPVRRQTGSISTITGKPITERVQTGQEPAGFGTQVKTGFVESPEAKINIFAQARFPDIPLKKARERYGVIDGDVVYLANDGNIYREVPGDTPERVVSFLADLPGQAPAIIGGTAGSVFGGIPGASLGAGAGEATKQIIGKLAFDDPVSAGRIAGEAALGGVGETIGKGISSAVGKALLNRGGTLSKAAKGSIAQLDKAAAKEAEALGKRYGIDLFSPQTTELPELIDQFKLLADLPKTSNLLRDVAKNQQTQVQGAIEQFANEITTDAVTPFTTGKRLSETAEAAITELKKNRSQLAKPYYEAAFEKPVELNFDPIFQTLDGLLKNSPKGSKSFRSLSRVKRMLSDGRADNNLQFLDNVKKEIDAMLTGPDALSIAKTTQRNLLEVKGSLTNMADTASPLYAEARKVFQALSPGVTEAEQSIIGNIAKLEGDQVTQASKKLFASITSSPEAVRYARTVIKKNNPDVWDQAVKTYLLDVFENIKGTVSGNFTNLGGQFFKRTIGNLKQQRILKEALGKEGFQNFTKFADILRRTSLTTGKESATASRQVALNKLKEQGESKIVGLGEFRITQPFAQISKKINDLLFGNFQTRLADALVSPQAAKRLEKVRSLSGSREKQIKAFSTFLSLAIGGEYSKPGLPEMTIPFETFQNE